jgi:hypothetical protein
VHHTTERVVVTGDCQEGLWYVLRHCRDYLKWEEAATLTIGAESNENWKTVPTPGDEDIVEVGHLSRWSQATWVGTNETTLIELAMRVLATFYIGNVDHPLGSWRTYHTTSVHRHRDVTEGPVVSWSHRSKPTWPQTLWWATHVPALQSIVVRMANTLEAREWLAGSGLATNQVKVVDDLLDSAVAWASEQIGALLLRAPEGEVGADRVGRVLVADNGTWGVSFKENQTRFKGAYEENIGKGMTHQQWSWLKTIVLYKVNTLRAMTQQQLFSWRSDRSGAFIGFEATPQQEAEAPAPPQPSASSGSSGKRTAEHLVEHPGLKRVMALQGQDLPMKAPSVAGPHGAKSKAPPAGPSGR